MTKVRVVDGSQFFFLNESKVFLDSVIENIPDMIFVKDAKDLKFVRFNRAGEKLIGLPREEMIGKSDYDFFPTEQADFFTAKDRQVLASNTVEDIPEEYIHTKNGMRVLHTKKIPICDERGRPKFLLGISEDITEKKKVEKQALKLLEERAARKEAEKSAERFAFLSETSKTLSSLSNTKEILESFSQILCRTLADWCLIEIAGDEENPNSLFVNQRDEKKRAAIDKIREKYERDKTSCEQISKVIQTGEPEFYNKISESLLKKVSHDAESFRILKSAGMKSAIIVPLKSFNKVLGAALLVISESNRRYSKTDMTMAQDLAERTSFILENARLLEKAQEANRAKTAFLAHMSHEVRTPLGAIIGFAELALESENLPGDQAGFIDTILRNGKQLLKIVDEILDISKVESDRLVVENIEFSILDLVDDVVSLLKHKAEEKGLQFNVQYQRELPNVVKSDPTRLRQILINIIGNAIKFTERGFVNLKVGGLKPNRKGEVLLEFVVQDSGIGIERKQAGYLFRPFSQADCSTTRKYGGTGLGLYLSKKLAHALGGDLTLVESEPGVGSTFVLSVQAEFGAKCVSSQKFKTSGSIKTQEEALFLRRELKVLIVDDSEDNRDLMGMFISHMGNHVEFAENGIEGFNKAMEGDYDVVFMDIEMPVLDGFQAIKKLRRHGYDKPVIALTAHAMKGDRERCLREGFDDYLAKPICRESLGNMLKNREEEPFAPH